MGRKRRSSPLEDLFEIAALLPWWVGVLLAAAAYFGFHMIAVSPPPPTTPGHISSFAGHTLWEGLATALQYVVPLILLGGAGASAIRRRMRAGRTSDLESAASAATAGTAPRAAPAKSAGGEDLYELWKASPGAEVPRADKWSLALLRAIDWKRFEEVCAEYFRVCGFHATTKSHGPDGGVDVILYAHQDKSKVVNVVQCKQWKRQVGPKLLRELLGVMTDMKVGRGTFVTSSSFNDEAKRIAAENRINLIDGQGFLEQILKRPPAEQRRLLGVATEGDYLTPSCPSCGTKLLKRENKKDQSWFWGCVNYPRCRYTLNAAS